MSKARVIVLAVVNASLTPTQAASRYGVTRQWVHQLLSRYRQGGIDAVEARSKRPRGNARAIGEPVRSRIRQLRGELERAGLDHGPATIAWHLQRAGLRTPSLSSIRRNPESARGALTSASRRRNLTSAGSRISPIGSSRTAPPSRSSTGSTITAAICWAAPPTSASPAATSSTPSTPAPTATARQYRP